jgi:hypothetical protein
MTLQSGDGSSDIPKTMQALFPPKEKDCVLFIWKIYVQKKIREGLVATDLFFQI